MKTYHIKDLLKKELLIIELPENVKIYQDECDEGNHIGYSLTKFGQDSVEPFGLIDGYTLLGKPDKISEEDAVGLVDKVTYSYSDGSGEQTSFKHYNSNLKKGTLVVETATESLLSAIETVIFWDVNPSGDEPNKFYAARDFYGNPRISKRWSKWHEAESRTFDKSRTLIFVKN